MPSLYGLYHRVAAMRNIENEYLEIHFIYLYGDASCYKLYVYLGFKLGPRWEQAGAIFSKYTNFLLIPIGLIVIWFIMKAQKQKQGQTLKVNP